MLERGGRLLQRETTNRISCTTIVSSVASPELSSTFSPVRQPRRGPLYKSMTSALTVVERL